ncbi:MAG: hypothetical protein R3283_07965 [Balneolaceae bacterium]|nr:hypothetical protein [Balneolaceae bacterium]
MGPEEITFFAIIFGSAIVITFLGVVGSIIKAAIKRKSGNLSENKEFLMALREFKEKTDRRLSNLEAIVTDENRESTKKSITSSKKKEPKGSIEIEIEDRKESESQQGGKLKNMLNQ